MVNSEMPATPQDRNLKRWHTWTPSENRGELMWSPWRQERAQKMTDVNIYILMLC